MQPKRPQKIQKAIDKGLYVIRPDDRYMEWRRNFPIYKMEIRKWMNNTDRDPTLKNDIVKKLEYLEGFQDKKLEYEDGHAWAMEYGDKHLKSNWNSLKLIQTERDKIKKKKKEAFDLIKDIKSRIKKTKKKNKTDNNRLEYLKNMVKETEREFKTQLMKELIFKNEYEEKIAEIFEDLDKIPTKTQKQKQKQTKTKTKTKQARIELTGGKTRKHKGIIQTGGNKGRLKKGYRYSGKKLKSGLPQIIKSKKKIKFANANIHS